MARPPADTDGSGRRSVPAGVADRFGMRFEAVEGHDRAKLYVLHVDGHAGQHRRLEGGPALRGPLGASS
jgi:hypothetical protein